MIPFAEARISYWAGACTEGCSIKTAFVREAGCRRVIIRPSETETGRSACADRRWSGRKVGVRFRIFVESSKDIPIVGRIRYGGDVCAGENLDTIPSIVVEGATINGDDCGSRSVYQNSR